MSQRESAGTQVLVLEASERQGRRLDETVAGAGARLLLVPDWPALLQQATRPDARVAVLAFEALEPNPQERLQALRRERPGLRLVVAHTEGSLRARLGHRLWNAGAIDFFISRSMPPGELSRVLEQALAEAEALPQPAPAPASADPAAQLRQLRAVSAALTRQPSVAAVIRELHIQLPSLVEYALLLVAVPEGQRFKLMTFQTRPLPHQARWGLIEKLCAALKLSPEQLVLDETPATRSGPAPAVEATEQLVYPLAASHGLVGGMALLVNPRDLEATQQSLEFVALQLTTTLGRALLLESAARASVVDELTGCHNQKFFLQALESEWKRGARYGLPLSVALVDLDRFRRLNDVYGHLVGDEVLRALAQFLKDQVREIDHVARLEADQFAVVMPETGAAEAASVLERVRILAGSRSLFVSSTHGPVQVTFSAGIAGNPTSGARSRAELLDQARAALRSAKAAGRDRVCVAGVPGSEPVRAEVLSQEPGAEHRVFSRFPTKMQVRYLEIPDFERSLAQVSSGDISAGGISLTGAVGQFKRNSYALTYLEDSQKAMLTRVVWTADGDGEQRAGLRFVTLRDLESVARGDPSQPNLRKAMVVTSDSEVRLMVSRVLRAAQYQTTFLDDAAAWPPELSLDQFGLIVCGDAALKGELGARLSQLPAAGSRLRIVVVNESGNRAQGLGAMVSHQARHLVNADDAFDESLFATLNKLLLGEYFGIRKYLMWGARTRAWSIANSDEKNGVLDGVRALAEDVKCHPRIADLFVTAVDEMIINALYRAPDGGEAAGKPVAVEAGSDGRLLLVSVLDEHGRLKPEELYAGLGKALQAQRSAISESASSAGVGFKIMVESLSQLAVNIDPGRATEIIGIVDLRKSLREYRSSSPSVNVFSKG